MSRTKKKGSIKGRKLPHNKLKSVLVKFLRRHPSGALSARQLIKRLKIGNDKGSVVKALNALVKSGQVHQSEDGYYATGGQVSKGNTVTGIVDMTRSGSAFIVADADGDDIFVRAEHLHSALDGDTVKVRITRKGRRPSGEVVEILKRKVEKFVGSFYELKKYNVVVPDQAKVPFDIFVRDKDANNAQHGQKVVVRIKDWRTHSSDKSPEGEVSLVLGEAGSHDIEMQGILIQNGFDLTFPDQVIQEAKSLPGKPSVEDKKGRRDFREVPTFTIDPLTAKDFDDALSVRVLEDGNIEVGIHIADVTHFVKTGSAIDKEAYRRSTSVYLVDRVAPMLPEKLSNELCSLRPDEESLTFSAVMTFNQKYNVINHWFGKTTIFSDRRFTYEEAQEIIETGEGEHADEVLLLNKIATKLRSDKMRGGALAFETDEVQFILDEEGVPEEIYAKERKEAHLLVEDFMLLANREVARFIGDIRGSDNIPFVYRIHDSPDPDKLAELALFARQLGLEMKMDTPKQVAESFNKLAEAAREDEAFSILEPLAIRTMAKAEYNTQNIGHYGLAFDYYTHFTSPIRRYSDVLVHRLLYENIDGRTKRVNIAKLQDQCVHISSMERKAQTAERDSVKFKQAEYMQQFVGKQFHGTISGMIDRGFFVKLDDNHCEGLVGFERLQDAFSVDDNRLQATASRSGKKYRMGDRVQVRIVEANPMERRIEMELVSG